MLNKLTDHPIRTTQEMMALILDTAREDQRIRAAILNGSRANPNVTPDRFQDYDIVYIVTELAPFLPDTNWIDRFGERMILQLPDRMGDPTPRADGGFTYLMQFMDGSRIDLTLIPVEHIKDMEEDSLSLLLLDKDNLFEPFPPPDETSYLPTPPTHKAFADCCNEFWWVCPYAAKALAREEILYAKQVLDGTLRQQLMTMLTWWFGIGTNFKRNPGKGGRHLKEVLPPQRWELLLGTFSSADIEAIWQALFQMTTLFRVTALEVAGSFKFNYPDKEDRNVSQYLAEIRQSATSERSKSS